MADQPSPLVPDEVLTGEAVALDVQPLGFFLRALGCLIDVSASVALLLLLAWVGIGLLGARIVGDDVSGIFTVAATALVTVVVPVATETFTRGRSLGRWAVGGRIVRADGGMSGFRQALVRALVGVLEIWMTFGTVAALTGVFTPRSQRLGDLMAGTYCQRTRTPRVPPRTEPVPVELAEWAATADVARVPDALARRLAQFVAQAHLLLPSARARLAASLATELGGYVSPIPAGDPERFVRAAVAVRRDRERAALALADRRVDALVRGSQGQRSGFPSR